jgi:hypothetical protein
MEADGFSGAVHQGIVKNTDFSQWRGIHGIPSTVRELPALRLEWLKTISRQVFG